MKMNNKVRNFFFFMWADIFLMPLQEYFLQIKTTSLKFNEAYFHPLYF